MCGWLNPTLCGHSFPFLHYYSYPLLFSSPEPHVCCAEAVQWQQSDFFFFYSKQRWQFCLSYLEYCWFCQPKIGSMLNFLLQGLKICLSLNRCQCAIPCIHLSLRFPGTTLPGDFFSACSKKFIWEDSDKITSKNRTLLSSCLLLAWHCRSKIKAKEILSSSTKHPLNIFSTVCKFLRRDLSSVVLRHKTISSYYLLLMNWVNRTL